MNEQKTFLDAVIETFPFVGVAILGYSIHALEKHISFMQFLASALTAGFTAFLTAMITPEFGLSYGMTTMICGVIGYTGGKTIDIFSDAIHARLLAILDFDFTSSHKSTSTTKK